MTDYTHNGDSSKQTKVDARAAVNGNVDGSAKIKIACFKVNLFSDSFLKPTYF